jgi:hypothetical protein
MASYCSIRVWILVSSAELHRFQNEHLAELSWLRARANMAIRGQGGAIASLKLATVDCLLTLPLSTRTLRVALWSLSSSLLSPHRHLTRSLTNLNTLL